ncbi:N-acetylmuramoyl-L-alanine amidase [Hyalangium rubrum]|uniref:N-acetylmuramoyl-L-alanine amidase n=1 Tax=Hyalangium rubrum TaxID=3103134 RepID=A0ABU5H9Y4_9BACT|nr:N-acetylmuramoyl-L-alanine amidase [Hyalangium sp. s54d21]MDY7230285.1 N-acetylmuramoyl-L-alanine amidase [Hyalangium sp. s54d21]
MSLFRNTLATAAAALSLTACGPQQSPESEPPASAIADAAKDAAGRGSEGQLDPLFDEAARDFNVPADLLKAISFTETRWQMVEGHEEFEGLPAAYGVMALRGERLERGAALTGVSVEQARSDARANIRAGAALLSTYAEELKVERADVGAWAPAVARLSGITHSDAQADYIHKEVYATLRNGVVAEGAEGQVVASIMPTPVEAKFELPAARAMAAGPNYGSSIWRPSPNYNARPSGTNVSMIVIHTCEGGYSGCWSWLTNSAAGASAHYVVNESGSEISQLVNEANRAWHVAASYSCSLNGSKDCGLNGVSVNHFSVGIEHGGYASQTSFPTGQIDASAKLSCDISRDQVITRDSYHIVAHGRLQPSTRTDPGPNWPWSTYISKVNSYCGSTGGGATIIVDSNNANNNTASAKYSGSATWASGSSAGYYGSGYDYASTDAVSDPVTFSFYLSAPATKTIDAWWVSGTNRSTATPFIVWDANGNKLGTVYKNQQTGGGAWQVLGTYSFPAGWNEVQVSRWAAAGSVVIADAIRVR